MRYITRKIELKLLRGAALILVGGLAAGCSSDVSRFKTSDFIGTSPGPSRSVALAPMGQPHSASQPAEVDATYTGSVNRQALRPSATVGNSVAQQQTLPPPTGPGQYTPQVAASQPVQQQSLPAPTAPSATTNQNVALAQPAQTGQASATGARQSEAAQPVQRQATSNAPPPRDPAPQPGRDQRLAVLPDTPKPRTRSEGSQTSAAGTTTSNAGSDGTYTVVSGDTLYGVSRKTGASVESIKSANRLSDGYLQIGQKLIIPTAGSTPQTQVASAPKPAVKTEPSATPQQEDAKPIQVSAEPQESGETQLAAVANSDALAAAPGSTGIGKLRWPVRGRIVSEYGSTQGAVRNDGIDISVPAGTPVKSAENGVVIYAGDGLKEFGNTVLVRHDDGMVTVYGHATALRVKRGDKVKRGQEIALSGMSGNAEQPKLHFEVRKDASPVNPTTYLE